MKSDYLEAAIYAAREAGKILMAGLDAPRDIRYKGEVNLVTEIDLRSEKRILSILQKRFPSHCFLAEESGTIRSRSPYEWIIDPLDGTTNYAHNDPIFAVSIALAYRGELQVGVVFDPTRDELFTSQKGEGAYLNGRRLQVTRERKLRQSLLGTGFPYVMSDMAVEMFFHMIQQSQALRRGGSAALDLAYTAAGRFDGFWELHLQPWDMAAGILLVTEAGGAISTIDGGTHTVTEPETVATNGRIHKSLLQELQRVKRRHTT